MIPERIAAIPSQYMPASTETRAWSDVPPGHRYQMYFFYWEAGRYTAYKDARLPDISHFHKNERNRIRKQFDAEKKAALGETCPLGPSAWATLNGLRQRQQALIASLGNHGFTLAATSTAPFATGLGNEHPIENGFAFLTPYGLPYLAGSGVKGVLRRAAEELALFADEYAASPLPDPLPPGANGKEAGDAGLTLLDVWWLFGFEGAESKHGPAAAVFDPRKVSGQAFQRTLVALAAREDLYDFIRIALADDRKTQAYYLDRQVDRRVDFLKRLISDDAFRQSIHTRGTLDFWDVFPAPAGKKLVLEIMTPHHAGYYMNGKPPHDAESPIPVPFLAVPARSAFDFHVVCAPGRLPEPLRANWKDLLQAAFNHAFDWLGFGAKTSVGYGAMQEARSPSAKPEKAGSASKGVDRHPAQPETSELVWPAAKLTFDPGSGEIKAFYEGKTTAAMKGEDAQALLTDLAERAKKLKKDKELKNVAVRVRLEGNLITLLALEPGKA